MLFLQLASVSSYLLVHSNCLARRELVHASIIGVVHEVVDGIVASISFAAIGASGAAVVGST